MDALALTGAWLQAVNKVQLGTDPLPKKMDDGRTMVQIIERALRHGVPPADPSAAGQKVDRQA